DHQSHTEFYGQCWPTVPNESLRLGCNFTWHNRADGQARAKKVTFEDCEGAIGFVNIRNAHWKCFGSNEVEDSKQAGQRFGQYFKMHRNRFGKEDWVDIKWQPGTITHPSRRMAPVVGSL
ncbi:Hypothetical protein SMAX5B_016918, partial [Scophthalmus maximus]